MATKTWNKIVAKVVGMFSLSFLMMLPCLYLYKACGCERATIWLEKIMNVLDVVH